MTMNSPRSKLRGITLASPKSVWRHSSPLQAAEYSAVDSIKSQPQHLGHLLHILVAATGKTNDDRLLGPQRGRELHRLGNGVRALHRRNDSLGLAQVTERL